MSKKGKFDYSQLDPETATKLKICTARMDACIATARKNSKDWAAMLKAEGNLPRHLDIDRVYTVDELLELCELQFSYDLLRN